MAMSKKLKSIAAGKNDKFDVTYTEFAANQERTEISVGEGKEFDNDALLEMLGFEKDPNGILRLQAVSHEFEREANGKVIRYEIAKRNAQKMEKMQEQEDEKGA